MDKYILVLGAGLMQRRAIEACHELHYKALVVDANPNALCVPFADRFEQIDLKDKEKLAELGLSLKEQLSGVFTCGTDFSASVSYVCQKCNLPSHNFEACLNASDKIRMRQCFKDAKVSSPDFVKINKENYKETTDFINKNFDYPLVVKPIDNMGARGCRMVRNSQEFEKSVQDAVNYSRSGNAIVENYMKGKEYSIDAILYENTFTITGFADRHIFFEPYFIELGHTLPSTETEEVKKALFNTFADGVHALGLTKGCCKADIKFTKDGAMIGEIAARLSGGYMSGWTFPYASDLNLTKEALKVAMGNDCDLLKKNRVKVDIDNKFYDIYEIPCSKVSAERAFISIPGKIKTIHNEEKIKYMPFVQDVLFRVHTGDEVVFPRNNVEKCGNIITVSSDYQSAVESCHDAISQITLELEYPNEQTQLFLDGIEDKNEKGFPYNAFEFTTEEKDLIEKAFTSGEKLSTMSEKLPETLLNKEDFNHKTLRQVFLQTDEICLCPAFDSAEFVKYLTRGSIQGILYLAEKTRGGK